MNTIYLIRHGQKENKPGDPPLTALGIKQAKATATYIHTHNIHSIYTSPFLRTKQTAEIIAKQFQLPVIPDERLKERLNWGDRKNETFNEFWNEWQKTDIDRTYKPLYGKSSTQNGLEMKNFLATMVSNHNQSIVIVTHGGTIGDLLRTIIPDVQLPHIINAKSGAKYLDILECSITQITADNSNYSLNKINFIDHLQF